MGKEITIDYLGPECTELPSDFCDPITNNNAYINTGIWLFVGVATGYTVWHLVSMQSQINVLRSISKKESFAQFASKKVR